MDRTGEGVQTDRAGRNGVGRRGTNPGSREKDGADRTAKLDEQRADRTAKPDEDARVPDRNARRMSRATNARSTEDSRADVCADVCGEGGPATAPRRMCFIPEVGPVERIRGASSISSACRFRVARTGWADDENRVVTHHDRRALRLRLPTSHEPSCPHHVASPGKVSHFRAGASQRGAQRGDVFLVVRGGERDAKSTRPRGHRRRSNRRDVKPRAK